MFFSQHYSYSNRRPLRDIQEAVLDFIKATYDSQGSIPSVRSTCDEVEGMSRRRFYEVFEGGLSEACRLAGVPEPKERIAATKRALEARGRQSSEPDKGIVNVIVERIEGVEQELETLKHERRPLPDKKAGSPIDIRPVDSFVINLSQNYPYGSNGPWQILRNGVPTWELPHILSAIYPPRIVRRIISEIYNQGGVRTVYFVEIIHRNYGLEEVRVQPMNSEYHQEVRTRLWLRG